jgi:hypothetical protein
MILVHSLVEVTSIGLVALFGCGALYAYIVRVTEPAR